MKQRRMINEMPVRVLLSTSFSKVFFLLFPIVLILTTTTIYNILLSQQQAVAQKITTIASIHLLHTNTGAKQRSCFADITTCFTQPSSPSSPTTSSPSSNANATGAITGGQVQQPTSSPTHRLSNGKAAVQGAKQRSCLADITTCFTQSGSSTIVQPSSPSQTTTTTTTTPSTQRPVTANFSQYNSPNLGFSIAYPANWVIKEYPSQGVSFISTQAPYARISVNVTENSTFQNMNLNEYTNIKFKQLRNEFKGFHFVNENDTILSGRPTHYLVFTFESNSTTFVALIAYTIIGDRAYELVYITLPTANYENTLSIVRNIRETFQINESSTTSANQTTTNNSNGNNSNLESERGFIS
jgi:hypothetical protein